MPAMLADSANTSAHARRDRQEHGASARDAPQRAVVHGPLDRRHADDSRRASPSRSSPSPATRPTTSRCASRRSPCSGASTTARAFRRSIQLSQQTQSTWLAKESMSTLARSGDPRARQYLRTAVQAHRSARRSAHRRASRARPGLRDRAGRRAASRGLPDAQERSLARSRVQRARRDRRLGEHEVDARAGAERQRADLRCVAEPLDAASRAGAPIAELIQLYDTTTDPNMKESLIGIYMRNGEQGGGRQAAHDREGRREHLASAGARSRSCRGRKIRGSRQALQDIVMK